MLKIRGIAANLGIKKPALSGNAGHFIHKVQVEPADFEPLSQSPNLLDSNGTAKHRPCVCPCLQLPVNAMSKDLCWPCPSQYRTLLQGRDQILKKDLFLTVPALSSSLPQRKKELTFSSIPAMH
tara:strand:- start:708 stop:1079 length:372 start_codon:yes stop_codon:yes gene_type:complete